MGKRRGPHDAWAAQWHGSGLHGGRRQPRRGLRRPLPGTGTCGKSASWRQPHQPWLQASPLLEEAACRSPLRRRSARLEEAGAGPGRRFRARLLVLVVLCGDLGCSRLIAGT